VLNQDFRKMNAEVSGIPAVFQGVAADVEFEFCLATQDPEGKTTTGITRSYTQNSVGIGGTPAIHYEDQGGADAWNSAHYLNIWVAKFAGGVGGIGSFPGEDPPAEDGIEIDYRQFGTLLVEPPYHLGRTTTHEIGHYFNLEHPWGPGISDCCEDDFVNDTPPACETYLAQCPTHPVTSCSSPDQFMNFMFYTDDACMAMFTQGQKQRMLAALNEFRAGLLTSQGCQPVAVGEKFSGAELVVFQNPVKGSLQFEIKNRAAGTWRARLFDSIGREVFRQEVEAGTPVFIGISELAPGVLWLEIEKNGLWLIKKVAVY
ncbi:MAG: M43 family zinc metalloprotease, partial [Bacteroidota bacterium]